MKSLCIFDLDGTLSNTLRSLHFFCNSALKECGFPLVEDIRKTQYMVGNGVYVLLRRLLTESLGSYTQEQYDRLFSVYSRLYAEDPMHLVKEYDGVSDLLEALLKEGIRLAVLSNKPNDMTKQVVSRLYPQIPFALCRGQVDGFPKKPAPDGVFWILEHLRIPKEDAVYIGDSEVDIQTGKNAGLFTVGVTWGFRTKAELKAVGCRCMIDRPMDLLPVLESL